jgi:hypothetical protein
MIGAAGLQLVYVLFMKEVLMCRDVDLKFALKEKRSDEEGDIKKGQDEKPEPQTEIKADIECTCTVEIKSA